MKYRALDDDGDRKFGFSADDFYVDQVEAVAQAIVTRLRLGLGEWFLDTTEGTGWDGKVLGTGTAKTRDLELASRIVETTGVESLTAFSSKYNGNTRLYSVQAGVETIYGSTTSVQVTA